MTTLTSGRDLDVDALLAQIGRGNVLAISGGRVRLTETGIVLPVAAGYRVEIDLEANDTYTVRRVFVRGARRFVKVERTNVYCDEVGEIAYRASCYLDDFAA
jgi:hypothetical protein